MKVSKFFTLVAIVVIGAPFAIAKNVTENTNKSDVIDLEKVVSKNKLLKDLNSRIEKIDSIYKSINAGVKDEELCKEINELYFKRDSLWALLEHSAANPEAKLKLGKSLVLSSSEIKKKAKAALPSNGINFCGGGIAELNPELVGNTAYLAGVLNSSRNGNVSLQEIFSERMPASD